MTQDRRRNTPSLDDICAKLRGDLAQERASLKQHTKPEHTRARRVINARGTPHISIEESIVVSDYQQR